MIIAAGIAAQAASALAGTLRGKDGAGSAGSDFANLTADIGALLPGGAKPGVAGSGAGTGSIIGDLGALGQDLLGGLGLGAPATAPGVAAQAYASASTLAT